MTPDARQRELLPDAATTIALGIDPGQRFCGWAVVGKRAHHIWREQSGVWRPSRTRSRAWRLSHIASKLRELLYDWGTAITTVGVESQFIPQRPELFGGAIEVAAARGACLGVLGGYDVVELNPSTVKKSLTGYGRAQKGEVKRAVQHLLGLGPIRSNDESDAIAIAITAVMLWRRQDVRP